MVRKVGIKFAIVICAMLSLCLVLGNCMEAEAALGMRFGGSSQGVYTNCTYGNIGSCNVLVKNFLSNVDEYGGSKTKVSFHYSDSNGWKNDMLQGQFARDSIDDVYFMIYCGHGLKKGKSNVVHNTLHYYTMNSNSRFHSQSNESAYASNVSCAEVAWGKTASYTRWVALYTCNFLNTDDQTYSNMMQGINICMGFSTSMYVDSREGGAFGKDVGSGEKIIDSFLANAAKYQSKKLGHDIVATAIYAKDARNDTIDTFGYRNTSPASIFNGGEYYSISRTIPGTMHPIIV